MPLLRRRLMKQEESWTYILFPNEDGKIPAFIATLQEGEHVHIEYYAYEKDGYKAFVWYNILKIENLVINPVPKSNEASVYMQNTIMDFDVGADGDIVFSGSAGSVNGKVHYNRSLLGEYIKIRIT